MFLEAIFSWWPFQRRGPSPPPPTPTKGPNHHIVVIRRALDHAEPVLASRRLSSLAEVAHRCRFGEASRGRNWGARWRP